MEAIREDRDSVLTGDDARVRLAIKVASYAPSRTAPADSLVALLVVSSCYHAATTPSRSRAIHSRHHSVVIVGMTTA